MKCSLCGYEFEEKETSSACVGCPLTKGCQLIKCPNCGYEVPAEPRWLKRFIKRGTKAQRHKGTKER
ncbi:MAG: hypothetical protein GXO98_04865 [Nitrospirae bacterium]|nr:hypothetical protein [Nitrospirota bacterium]